MGLVSRFTVTPLLYACAALLATVLGLSAALVWQNHTHTAEIATLGAQVKAAKADAGTQATFASVYLAKIRELAAANRGNQAVVTDLQAQLGTAIGQNQDLQRINRDTANQLDAARVQRDAAARALQHSKDQTYATDAACADWGARPVCGAITDRLLEQWQAADQPAGDPGGH